MFYVLAGSGPIPNHTTMNDINKLIETIYENNIALHNSLVAYDNVFNSLQSEKLHHSITLESLKKMVNMVYDRFGDDFTLVELEALEKSADIIGDSLISMTVRNRIEKGNYERHTKSHQHRRRK